MRLSAIDVANATAPVAFVPSLPEKQAAGGSPLLRRVIGAALAAGVALRLWQYLLNRSLWLDEAYLALNLTHRSFAGLLRPLDFDQGAPLGFLWLEKSALRLFGSSEYALRLLPLLAGVVSLFLFYKLAKAILPPVAVAVAVGLFALSPSLIYYSSEIKQYAIDVAVAILLYCLALPGSMGKWSIGKVALFAVVGAAAIWVSHPSVFILATVAAVFALTLAAKRQWAALLRLSAAFMVWGVSLVFCYFLSLRALSHNHDLLAYWQADFMPLPPRSVSDFKWFVDSFFQFFTQAAGLQYTAIAGFAFLVGGARLFHSQRERLALLLGPGVLTLAASGLHKYPFGGRLALFLVPAALLLIAQGAEEVRQLTWPHSRVVACALIGLLLLDPAIFVTHHFAEPSVEVDHPGIMAPEELKPVIAYVQKRRQAGDFIYLFYGSQPAFRYYSELHGTAGQNLILGSASGSDPSAYAADLDRLRGKRVWVVLSHIHGIGRQESAYILFYLDMLGPRITSFHSPGAAVYLYDLTKPPSMARTVTTSTPVTQ